MNTKKKNIITNTVVYAFLIFMVVVVAFPLLYIVLSSFKTNSEMLAHPENIFPKEPTFDNYIQAWNSPNFSVKTMLWNSIYYTVVCVAITLISSSMCGYVFARGHFRGKKLVFSVFTALLFVNLGSITMYPYYEILDLLHFDKSLHSLLFIGIFGIPVTNIYLVKGFINGVPIEIDEAAKIDGCSFPRIFVTIIVPMIVPILATMGLLAFQGSWNAYLSPMIFTMSHPEQRTLIVGVMALKTSGEAASSWNLMLAGTAIALVPVLVAYCFGSRFFIEGIAQGAVKG